MVNNLLSTLRAHSGILKEKFKMSNRRWKEAFSKHKVYHVNTSASQENKSFGSDSSMQSQSSIHSDRN